MNKYSVLKSNIGFSFVIYILILAGFGLSVLYKVHPKFLYLISIIQFIPITFSYIYYRTNYFKNLSEDSFVKIIKSLYYMAILLIPFLTGFFLNTTIYRFDILNEYTLKMILSFSYTWIYLGSIKNLLFSNKNRLDNDVSQNIIFVLAMVLILAFAYPKFTSIVNYCFKLISDINFMNISIAIIMLCATLSMLSFSYHSLLKDDKIKNDVKNNGEMFFISTILSIFSIVSLYLFSIIFPNLKNISYDFSLEVLVNFLFVNISIVFMLIFLFTTVYALYFLLKGCKSSLKILNFDIFK